LRTAINVDIVKIELIRRWLERHPGAMSYEGGVVIDVGGIREYYHLLEPLFRPADLYVLNVLPERVKGVPSIVANAYQLPFKDETCEIITSFDVLEHLLEPERFVSEASRVLRPDGLFVLAIANLGDVYSRTAFLFGYIPFEYDPSTCKVGSLSKIKTSERGHKSAFTYRAVKELLDYYGFQIIGSSGYHYVESFYEQHGLRQKGRTMGFGRLRRLLGAILPTSLSEGMILFCKKKNEAYS
jgi:ubiquinone/menaquinone biosynthesis C-methylase UbiE